MNYYEARQRKKDGRWDFTVLNDGKVRSCGYCTPWEEIERGRKRATELGFPAHPHLDALVDQHKDNFHGDGHDTPKEAAECYKRYVLDLRTSYSTGTAADVLHRCEQEDCEEYTSLGARAGNEARIFWLCDQHRNRETMEVLYDPPFKIISSY